LPILDTHRVFDRWEEVVAPQLLSQRAAVFSLANVPSYFSELLSNIYPSLEQDGSYSHTSNACKHSDQLSPAFGNKAYAHSRNIFLKK